jgi:hypothetical protein
MSWLNKNTLIGYTSKRGTAWHYRADLQSDQPNHYPGPVPVEDVRRRLFNWDAESWEVYARKPGTDDLDLAELLASPDHDAMVACILDALGLRHQQNRQAITRSDNEHVMGIFTDDYEKHPYDEWLLTTVANILDDDLHIGSAGLLRGGAIAWVSVAAGRSRTMAERKREVLTRLYDHDQRVAPWHGTGWGVLQAVNTYTHHEGIVRGAERNMLNAVTGRTDDLDHQTLDTLAGVLGRPLALQAA